MIQRCKITTALAALLGLLCTPSHLLAQSGAGTIQGTVQDATSAAIPGATIHALNSATGVTLDTTSNAGGFFALKGLLAGTYKVTVAAAGMKKSESTITLGEQPGIGLQSATDGRRGFGKGHGEWGDDSARHL